MNPDRRYELKFVLDEVRTAGVLHWLHFNTTARKVYPDRWVNSVYFDDISYSSVRDNLSGVSNRKKIRLRWYQDINGDLNRVPVLELKIRKGRLGHKINFYLSDFQGDLMKMNLLEIMKQIQEGLAAQEFLFDEYMTPTLQVSYVRSYYRDLDGIRITIDRDIKFHGVSPHQKLSETLATPYPFNIMEIKFAPSMKTKVSKLIKPLHVTPKRHSKYLVGLAAMGQAVYL